MFIEKLSPFSISEFVHKNAITILCPMKEKLDLIF